MIRQVLKIIVIILFISPALRIYAGDRYWVFFRDKEGVEFDPVSYFDTKTIEKRLTRNIPLADYTDLPVNDYYIKAVSDISKEIHVVSRWLNAVSVSVSVDKLEKVKLLPFVEKTIPVSMVALKAKRKPFIQEIRSHIELIRKKQLSSMGASFFEQAGIDGKGIRIAVFDGGFPGVDTSPVFAHLRQNNQVIATWDFVRNREHVYSFNNHGTSVLTCITGKLGDKKFGMATGAEFLLARTEIAREVFSEEENWLAAMEWADKNGADIINSSLGYTYHRYYQNQMDGHSSLVSRAASLAASKGILVVNAAGNDGSEFWKVIGAPADADSILSIGGIHPMKGYKIHFSSFGPTYDGRLKPNVSAFGEVASSNAKKITKVSGTSFSAPLVAGFSACVMQMNPSWDNMKVYDEIQKSGHLYPYYDYAHGFGVPQASYFTGMKKETVPTFFFSEEKDSIKIVIILNNVQGQDVDIKSEEKDFTEAVEQDEKAENGSSGPADGRYNIDDGYLYFHIGDTDPGKILERYAVIKMMPAANFFSISKSGLEGKVLRAFYNGYSGEFEWNNHMIP